MENGSNSFRLMKTNGQLAQEQGERERRALSSRTRMRWLVGSTGNLFAQVSLPSLICATDRPRPAATLNYGDSCLCVSVCVEAQVLSRAESATRAEYEGNTCRTWRGLAWPGMACHLSGQHNLKPRPRQVSRLSCSRQQRATILNSFNHSCQFRV